MFNTTENEGVNEGFGKKETSIDVWWGGGIFEPEDDKKNMRQAVLLAVQIRGAGAGSILVFFMWKMVEHGNEHRHSHGHGFEYESDRFICVLCLVTPIYHFSTMRSPYQHSGTLLRTEVKHISYQIDMNQAHHLSIFKA